MSVTRGPVRVKFWALAYEADSPMRATPGGECDDTDPINIPLTAPEGR